MTRRCGHSPKPASASASLLAQELARPPPTIVFPVKLRQRIVADIRRLRSPRTTSSLVDTGAVKMWMARLYPTYEPNTCLISNGLSTMAFAAAGRHRGEDRPLPSGRCSPRWVTAPSS